MGCSLIIQKLPAHWLYPKVSRLCKLADATDITRRDHFAHTFFVHGVDKIGRDIHQWQQYKAALVHMWMRDDERSCVQNQIIRKKNVNINQARTILEGWRSSQRDLKALDVLKQRFKFEICACFDDLVEKHWLLSVPPGWCFIHA